MSVNLDCRCSLGAYTKVRKVLVSRTTVENHTCYTVADLLAVAEIVVGAVDQDKCPRQHPSGRQSWDFPPLGPGFSDWLLVGLLSLSLPEPGFQIHRCRVPSSAQHGHNPLASVHIGLANRQLHLYIPIYCNKDLYIFSFDMATLPYALIVLELAHWCYYWGEEWG